VITEHRAYFVPYRRELCFPPIKDILGEIFDLENPEVSREVEDRFSEGRIIVGDYFPSTKEVMVQAPLETSEYVVMRIGEVFGQ